MTAGFALRALGGHSGLHASDVADVTAWCWAGHDGLHLSAQFPHATVPTGFVWGWGDDVWVRWRTDPRARDCGAELRRGDPGEGYRAVTVDETPPAYGVPGSPLVPAVVAEPRYLQMATGRPPATQLRGQPMVVLRVREPSLIFFALTTDQRRHG